MNSAESIGKCEQERDAEVRRNECHSIVAAKGCRSLEQADQREDQEDRALVGNLALQIAPFRCMRLHG